MVERVMQQHEAEAMAAKREAHKPRTLSHKRWTAVHDSIQGWHVALVDNHPVIIASARREVENAIRRGNIDAAFEAAGDLLMARVRQQLSAPTDDTPSHG